jgi:hypothetical protein
METEMFANADSKCLWFRSGYVQAEARLQERFQHLGNTRIEPVLEQPHRGKTLPVEPDRPFDLGVTGIPLQKLGKRIPQGGTDVACKIGTRRSWKAHNS